MNGSSHFILYVADQERSSAFYAAVLGRSPRLDVPGMTEFELPGGGVLGLMPEAGIRRLLGEQLPDPASAHGVPRAELYLTHPHADACHARALRAGATELSPMLHRDWGDHAAYSLDLDGHVLAFARTAAPPWGTTLITHLDHVQLAMPPGQEDAARAFFVGLLGMEEEAKPEPLASRGGCWFRAGSVAIHLGVEADFRPQRKAHPALAWRTWTPWPSASRPPAMRWCGTTHAQACGASTLPIPSATASRSSRRDLRSQSSVHRLRGIASRMTSTAPMTESRCSLS